MCKFLMDPKQPHSELIASLGIYGLHIFDKTSGRWVAYSSKMGEEV